MKFQKGDRVAVTGWIAHEWDQPNKSGEYAVLVDGDNALCDDPKFLTSEQLDIPSPVPVADLLEELECVWSALGTASSFGLMPLAWQTTMPASRARELRSAREAAQAPKYTEGQEVWVRGHLASPCHDHSGKRLYVTLEDVSGTWVSEDDICTEKP